jgi:hypothetical protein
LLASVSKRVPLSIHTPTVAVWPGVNSTHTRHAQRSCWLVPQQRRTRGDMAQMRSPIPLPPLPSLPLPSCFPSPFLPRPGPSPKGEMFLGVLGRGGWSRHLRRESTAGARTAGGKLAQLGASCLARTCRDAHLVGQDGELGLRGNIAALPVNHPGERPQRARHASSQHGHLGTRTSSPPSSVQGGGCAEEHSCTVPVPVLYLLRRLIPVHSHFPYYEYSSVHSTLQILGVGKTSRFPARRGDT